MENNFIAEVTALGPEHKKLAEKLIKKMADYSHWPDSKNMAINYCHLPSQKKWFS